MARVAVEAAPPPPTVIAPVGTVPATTENPAFYLNPALRSRCQLIALKALEPGHIRQVLARAWSRERPSQPEPTEVFEWLSHWAGGDLRSALSGLETWMEMPDPDLESLQGALGGRMMFDRADGHYDLASAFQKSLRGSDADAALYYLSRMIRGGEDPRFIARRLMVCSAEDVGNADPQAFLLCEAASRAVEQIGWPEARIPLAQAVIYVANAPKSNATILGIDAALAAEDAPIPDAIRDAHTATARKAGGAAACQMPSPLLGSGLIAGSFRILAGSVGHDLIPYVGLLAATESIIWKNWNWCSAKS